MSRVIHPLWNTFWISLCLKWHMTKFFFFFPGGGGNTCKITSWFIIVPITFTVQYDSHILTVLFFNLTPSWWRFSVSFWPHRNLKMTCEEEKKGIEVDQNFVTIFFNQAHCFLIINHGKDPPILQQILGLQQINHGKFFPLIKAYKPESSHRCIHSSRPPTSRLADNNMYVHISELGALFFSTWL